MIRVTKAGILPNQQKNCIEFDLNWVKAIYPSFSRAVPFGLVGVVEELLFRGLVYAALDEWLGTRWAIWGSSLGFGLWHVFGQGPVVGATAVFYGLIFALMRWRAGGISGLIFVHGLMDFTAVQILPDTDVLGLGRPDIAQPTLMFLGLGLILAAPLYLWLLHPCLAVVRKISGL